MTGREKAGCGIAIITLLIRLPLAYVLSFLILRHVGATDVMWLIFWIGLPLALFLEVGSKLIENGIAGKE
jgi:hypothetical protein